MQGPDPLFSVRIGARLPDRELFDGVPDWLMGPLLDWLVTSISESDVARIALRIRLSVPESDNPKHALRTVLAQRALESDRGRWDILDAIDFACRTVGDLWIPAGWTGREPIPGTEPYTVLNRILRAGGSAYQVRDGQLERRVDATAVAAFEQAAASADEEASLHLRRAWATTYGREPDPSLAYGEAIRAMEAVVCPLVLPNDPRPTLGKAIGELQAQPDNWLFVLPGEREAMGAAPLRLMLQLAWTAQRSRHAGGPDTRDQLQAEAEAVLPVAVTVVQWFTSGAIQPAVARP